VPPPATEHDAVDESEQVLRRFSEDSYKAHLDFPVERGAFSPSSQDVNGLSYQREHFSSVAAVAERYPGRYLSRLSVAEVLNIQLAAPEPGPAGLTFEPDPLPPTPDDPDPLKGHALMPQITPASKKARKEWYRQVTFKLAQLASTQVVYRPPPSSP
jgi:hypothetical protein